MKLALEQFYETASYLAYYGLHEFKFKVLPAESLPDDVASFDTLFAY